jgi:hypothetical protein
MLAQIANHSATSAAYIYRVLAATMAAAIATL